MNVTDVAFGDGDEAGVAVAPPTVTIGATNALATKFVPVAVTTSPDLPDVAFSEVTTGAL